MSSALLNLIVISHCHSSLYYVVTMTVRLHKHGQLTFLHLGPSVWNIMPDNFRAVEDFTNFNRRQKTH